MKCPICEAKNPTKLTKNNYKCEHCGSWFSIEGKYISLDEKPLSNMEPKENILMEGINIIEENSRLGRKVKEQQKEIIDLKKHIYLKEATGDAEGIVSFGGRIAPQKPRSILDRLRINRKEGNGGENEDD